MWGTGIGAIAMQNYHTWHLAMERATLHLDSDDYLRLKRVEDCRHDVAIAVAERASAAATLDLKHVGAIAIKGRPLLTSRDAQGSRGSCQNLAGRHRREEGAT
jgi:hypothetical protein